MQNSQGKMLYYELAGHPLPSTSDCQSSLRVLRAAATHFPQLHRLVCLLYEAIRQHRLLESIDTVLCAGILTGFQNCVAFHTINYSVVTRMRIVAVLLTRKMLSAAAAQSA